MPPAPPLQKQPLDIPLGKGLAEHIDPRVLPPGGLTLADNVVVNKQGALEKRDGYASISNPDHTIAGSVPATHRLATVGGELLALATVPDTVAYGAARGLPHAFSYTPTAGGWTRIDDVSACSVRRDTAHRSAITQKTPFVTYTAGYLCYWWAITGNATYQGIYVRVVDPVTGTVFHDDVRVVNVANPVLSAFTVGAYSVLVYADILAGGNLIGVRFDPVTGSSSTVTLDASGAVCFDAAPIEGDTASFAIAWVRLASPTVLRVSIVTALTLAASANATYSPPRNIDAVTVTGKSGGKVYVAWYESSATNVNASAFNGVTLAAQTAPVTLLGTALVYALAAGIDGTGQCQVLMNAEPAVGEPAVVRETIDATGAIVGLTGKVYSTVLLSRPFLASNGRMYAAVQSNQENSGPLTAVLVRTDQINETCGFRLAGVLARSLQTLNDPGAFLYGKYPCSFVAATTGGEFITALAVVTVAARYGEAFGTDLATLNFAAPQSGQWNSAQAQQCLTLTGGLTGSYDGMAHVETGFIQAPWVAQVLKSTAAGSMALGSYLYCFTYEWVDSRGNAHYSPVSATVAVTLTGTENTVTLQIATLGLTERGQSTDGAVKQVRIHVFRTLVNSPGPFYRLTSRVATTGTEYLENTSATIIVTFVDIRSDILVEALGYGFLYTDGGILESQCAPPARAITSHKNRLWLASCEDGKKVYYSKLFTPSEAPGFNEILSLRVDDSPDDVTALATLDEKLVIFTRSRVYVVVGDGPDDTGSAQSGTFSTPQLVSATDGCVDPRSVVSFSGGVFFQSEQGLTLLGRDMAVSYAGANVLSTLNVGSTLLGVAHDTTNRRIIWLQDTGPVLVEGGIEVVSTNRFIVYDYGWDVWATWTPTGLKPMAHTFWSGAHVYADIEQIYQGGAGATPGYDNGEYPVTTIATPWLHPSAIGGFQRVLRLFLTARRKSYHKLYVDVYVDMGDNVLDLVQTATFDLTESGTSVVGLPVERLMVHLAKQKCSAIKFVIYDEGDPFETAPAVTTPLGFSLAGLTLLLGIKQGTGKLPAYNKA